MTKYVQKDLVGEHLDHNRHDPREKGPIRNDRHKKNNFIRFPKLVPKAQDYSHSWLFGTSGSMDQTTLKRSNRFRLFVISNV